MSRWRVALLFAFAICGVAVWLFTREGGDKDNVAPEGDAPAYGKGTPGADPVAGTQGDGALIASNDAKLAGSLPSDPARATTGGALRRVMGTVVAVDGGGISDVCVRWIPSTLEVYSPFLHDRRALGNDGDVDPHSAAKTERIPTGALRRAFERSRMAATDEDGGYALDLESVGTRGFVVVSKPGFQMKAAPVPLAAPGDETASGKPSKTGDEPAMPVSRLDEVTLDFTRRAASAISGRVTQRGSADPAVGVVIQAGRTDPDSAALFSVVSQHAASAVTGPDGDYELQGLTPGEYRVVHRAGFSRFPGIPSKQGKRVIIENGIDFTGIDFEVSRGGTIEGVVLDLDDEPLEGAECTIVSYTALAEAMSGNVEKIMLADTRKAATGAGGRFVFHALEFGEKYGVIAKRKGFAFAKSTVIELSRENPVKRVELRVSKGWSIAGYVLNADGSPAPHVPVVDRPDYSKALFDKTYHGAIETRTDEAGAFVLEDLPPGGYDLTAGELKPHDFFLKKPATTRVVLDGTSNVEGVKIVLGDGPKPPGAGIAGVVVDEVGQPLEGASVRYSSALDWMGLSGGATKTGAGGRFEITRSLEGALRLNVSKEGYAETVLDGVLAPRAGLVLTLARLARLSGKVFLADGTPAPAGAKVRARSVNENAVAKTILQIAAGEKESGTEGEVETDGKFSIAAEPGEIEVVATVPGHAPGLSSPVNVVAGQEYDGIKIVVSEGAILYGRVLFPNGDLAEGVTVNVRRLREDGKKNILADLMPQFFGSAASSTSTNANGEFEIPHLEPGKYALRASHREYAPSPTQKISVRADEQRRVKDLTLRVGSSVVGTVEMNGKPKAGMMVQLVNATTIKRAFSRPDGSFEFKGLGPGDYALSAMDMLEMMKQRWVIKNRVVAVAAESEAEANIVFGSGKKVHGEISGLVPGVMRAIIIRRAGGPKPEETDITDLEQMVEAMKFQVGFTMVTEDGPYEVSDIASGEYILEVIQWPTKFTSTGEFEKVKSAPELRRNVTIRDADLKLDLRVR